MTVVRRSREDATMRINPPTLFWILIAAIVAVDRFFSLVEFAEPWLPWCGAVLVIAGVGVSAAAKRQFQRIGTNVYTFKDPGKLVTTGLFGISRNPPSATEHWGHRDIAFRRKELDRWKSELSDLEVHEFTDCGHYLAEEAPDVLLSALRAFLTDSRAPAPRAAAR